MREMDEEERVTFLSGCWAWWEARNKLVFEEQIIWAGEVIRRVRDIMTELGSVGRLTEARTTEGTVKSGWVCPKEGVVKINIDARVIEGIGTGLGVVCRDSGGSVCWGVTEQDHASLKPREAKAAAVLTGVREALRRGCKNVVIESDCLEVVEALK
ncbi:hypothetical protein vseg_013344 [Gypsophila vaccaria]